MEKTKYLKFLKERYHKFSNDIIDRKIGIELEFHVVLKDGNKPDISVLKNLLNEFFKKHNFQVLEFDFDGNAIKGEKDKDIISYEACYNIIEISLAPLKDINLINQKTNCYISQLQVFLNEYNIALLPLGINPFPWAKEVSYLNNDYWETYQRFLEDYNLKKEFSFINVGSFFCSSQIHLDLKIDEIPTYFNIINRICFLKALLFSNSSSSINNCLCLRDLLWQQSACAYHKNNVGVTNQKFTNFEEVLLSLLEKSIYFIKRDEKRIYFKPHIIEEFLNKESIEGFYIENLEKKSITFKPSINDLNYTRPYNSIVITPLGTCEIRSECIQPFEDSSSNIAFHLGLFYNLDKIKDYISSMDKHLNKFTNVDLREKAIFQGYGMQKELDFNLEDFIYNLLLLIKEGLEKRNKGEEKYLNRLFERLKNKTNPAIDFMKKLKKGLKIEEIIQDLFLKSEVKI